VRDAIYEDRDKTPEERDRDWEKIRLVLIGGCRNAEDESRVKDLKDLSSHLAVDSNVEFKVNLSFDDLKKEMGAGMIGLHTMWNEHFGIGEIIIYIYIKLLQKQ
jgi:alpha-1,2-mannosyltransferase